MTSKQLQQWIIDNLLNTDNTKLINVNLFSKNSPLYKNNIDIFNLIYNRTKDIRYSDTIAECIYLIYNNITTSQKCSCGNKLRFVAFTQGYIKSCSLDCKVKNKRVEHKLLKEQKSKYIENENITNDDFLKILNDKFNIHKKERWDKYIIKHKIKNKLESYRLHESERYIEIAYRIVNNIKEIPKCKCGTILKLENNVQGYRTFCSTKCDEFKNHVTQTMKATCMENHGVEYYSQTEEYKEKARLVWSNRTQDEVDALFSKCRTTMFNTYGSYHNWSNDCILRNNFMKTVKERYGVDWYTQTEEYREKCKETCIEKYGVEHVMQCPEIFEKSQKQSYRSKTYTTKSGRELKYQGYEDKLLDELFELYDEDDITTSPTEMPKFIYIDNNNKSRRYYPDVFVKSINTIYEVKSEYTLKKARENNIFDFKKESVIKAGFNFILKVY